MTRSIPKSTRTLCLATLLGLLAAAGCSDATGGGANSQTHWLAHCTEDGECGSLSCMCGACVAPCGADDGCGHVREPMTECVASDAEPARALCGGEAPQAVCLEPCGQGCADGQQCVAGSCIPMPPSQAGSGGTGGAGGASGAAGNGGVGGSGGSGAADAGGTGGGSADAGPDAATDAGGSVGPVDCNGTAPKSFPAFDRSCDTVDDCALVRRSLSCCGTQLVTSVRADEAAAFEAAAAECDQQLAACGCAQGPSEADDGTTVSAEHPYASMRCDAKQCTTSFADAATTPCGASSCNAATEICVMHEPIGPAIQYACQPVPGVCGELRDCNCAAETLCNAGFDVCGDPAPNTIDCVCPTCQ